MLQTLPSRLASPAGAASPVTGAYKVDISRGERIGRVSSEWFSRPDDERYLSLGALHAAVRGRAERATARTVETKALRVEASRDDAERLALIVPGQDAPVAPTHWSYGQLCSLVGAPASYMRQLPAPLTGIIRFGSLEATGDAAVGAVVEVRPFDGRDGQRRVSLAVRSDLPLEAQVVSQGATWLDRTLIAREPVMLANGGFGAEVRDALAKRAEYLATEGLASRQGARTVFARDLLDTLGRREIDSASVKFSAESGLPRVGSAEGEHVAGVYRRRVQLASGRFAMIDNGLGFELVPWKPALEEHLGRHISGVVQPGGSVAWSFSRTRGLGIG